MTGGASAAEMKRLEKQRALAYQELELREAREASLGKVAARLQLQRNLAGKGRRSLVKHGRKPGARDNDDDFGVGWKTKRRRSTATEQPLQVYKWRKERAR
jgi:hypothetical protein